MSDTFLAWLADHAANAMIRRLAAEVLRLRAALASLENETAQ